MGTNFLRGQITATENLILAYETAVTDLVSGGIQQYTFDTGQTRQVVTKATISTLNSAIDGLYNRLATLEARCNGAGVIGVPGW